jgi:FK506-binding protein 2
VLYIPEKKKKMSKLNVLSMLLALFVTLCYFVQGAKLTQDLPADAPLRIGVTHRAEKCEQKSQPGDQLSMHYTGTLINGEQFDSSVGRAPFDFVLGGGQVIKGWDTGLVGMCVGEKRKLTIPSGLGYGSGGSGKIPGGATLIFEVELLKINRASGEL